jgi:pimeloyl-ACP methyl ester carboxylesterase
MLYKNFVKRLGIKLIQNRLIKIKRIIIAIKNLNSDFSQNYKEAVLSSTKPVVMSGGIFSNLETFKDGLGTELAEEGYDVWTIEMTGGPQIECSDCPDYTYQDLVDYYWPALVAGAIEYSGKNKVDYVGHSNGCRAALSSLNSYSNGKNNAGYVFNSQTGQYDTLVDLPNLPVDKFFGIACPSALNGDSTFIDVARTNIVPFIGPKVGDVVMSDIEKSHITMFDFASKAIAIDVLNPLWISLKPEIVLMASVLSGDSKISKNLLEYYKDEALNTNSDFDLSEVNINELHLYHGKLIPLIKEHDFLVPLSDQELIASNMNVPTKNNTFLLADHSTIKGRGRLKEDIKGELLND